MISYMPFRDMLMLHAFIGIGIVVFFAMRALGRNNTPPRWVGDFGSGFMGQQKKWIQWFTWAMTFEFLTSLFYIHTGLFYYEIGMSIFEACAMTIGAFVADRLVDFFLGVTDKQLPFNLGTPNMDGVKDSVRTAKSKVYDFSALTRESLKARMKTPEVSKDTLAKENKDFDDLVKGH